VLGRPFLKSAYTVLDYETGKVGLGELANQLKGGDPANFEDPAAYSPQPTGGKSSAQRILPASALVAASLLALAF
jgi:hypothetical protein